MLPIICAAIFRVSVTLSKNALSTTGIIKARDGASIKWTNLVSSRLWSEIHVFLAGSCKASNNTGTIAEKNHNS